MCAFERMTSGGFDVADGRVAVGVRLGEVFAQEFLIPVLACLLRAHPRLNLDVILDVAQERLLAGAADVMVVAGDFDHAGLDVRRGPTVRLGLYAHRRYLAASGSPTSLARLSDFAVISSRGPGSLNGFAGLVASFPSDVGLAIVCDSGAAQLLAIRSGMGIGAIPNVLAANDPDLVEVLPDIGIDIDTWVAMRREDLDVARIVIVRDALLVRPRPP
jgi:DNA-binding transcriptional LysR family regulator